MLLVSSLNSSPLVTLFIVLLSYFVRLLLGTAVQRSSSTLAALLEGLLILLAGRLSKQSISLLLGLQRLPILINVCVVPLRRSRLL